MKANPEFYSTDLSFWAYVRSISEKSGYTQNSKIKFLNENDIQTTLRSLALAPASFEILTQLESYFKYRADILNHYVEPRLMDIERVKVIYEELAEKHKPQIPVPMNKQKGEKQAPAYLTGIVNILIEANADGILWSYDPRILTTITQNNAPLRTLARRVDGCFPSCINPIAIWEIKEYYYTTTFGSRVADGVYETLLDGMELSELHHNEGIKVQHLLIVDAHYTWWQKGKSYLCRMIDMLHMGYVDEILFGYETIERLPAIVKNWVQQLKN